MVWYWRNKFSAKFPLRQNNFSQPTLQFFLLPTNPYPSLHPVTHPIQVARRKRIPHSRAENGHTDHIWRQPTGVPSMCAYGTTEDGAPIVAYKTGNLGYKSGINQKLGGQ